jgi:hypothetical protein
MGQSPFPSPGITTVVAGRLHRRDSHPLEHQLASLHPRIHGELLKLGYVLGERTTSRYLSHIRPEPTKPRSQTWATFLKNHARDIVAIDMFVVPTIRFQVPYIFIILGLEGRR